MSVGKGGIHSVDPKALYRATDEWDLLAADVASYYPALIDRKGIFPRTYGTLGAGLYRALLDRRLALKAAAKVAPTGAERHRLEIAQYGLKIILNSTFGKFGSRYSTLFDLDAMLAVTLSGQLLLIDFLERLEEAAAEVLSANTDGLLFRSRRGDGRWPVVLGDWQRDTEMVLEVDALDRVLLLGANCYATRDAAGKIKRKGTALKGDPDPAKASNAPVVADAVAAALLADVPPEVTIAAERRWVSLLLRDPAVGRRSGRPSSSTPRTAPRRPCRRSRTGTRPPARRSGSSIGSSRARTRRPRRPPAFAWRSPWATAGSRATSTRRITSPRPARFSTPSPGAPPRPRAAPGPRPGQGGLRAGPGPLPQGPEGPPFGRVRGGPHLALGLAAVSD